MTPFCIGDIEIPSRVILAALAGYSDWAYRIICRRLGFPFCATEMMLDNSLLTKGKLSTRLATLTDDDHPIAGQIVGNEPERMASAASVLCDKAFDIVDLNFACPVNKALRRKRGGYLMQYPDDILNITRAVIEASNRPVTLKLRQKFAASDSHDNFWRIAEGAFDAGAAAICVHGRSIEAKYSGPADWEFIAEVKQRFPDKTIIGSGDVITPANALALLTQTRVDAVTAARGAMGNPWFFLQFMDVAAGLVPFRPDFKEQVRVLKEHFALACDLYGPLRGARHMRKFGIRYAKMHTRPKAVRMAFVAVKTMSQWHEVLDTYYTDEYEQMGPLQPGMPEEPLF